MDFIFNILFSPQEELGHLCKRHRKIFCENLMTMIGLNDFPTTFMFENRDLRHRVDFSNIALCFVLMCHTFVIYNFFNRNLL